MLAVSEGLAEAQGKQNPEDPAAFLSGPAALRTDGLTSGISIETSTVAAASSAQVPTAPLLGTTHCHRGQMLASQRCVAVPHTSTLDSGPEAGLSLAAPSAASPLSPDAPLLIHLECAAPFLVSLTGSLL